MALHRRIEPPRQFTAEKAQQWFKLLDAIDAELGDIGFDKVLWVDQVDGNDGTAQRGSLSYKYATIQAALNAAVAGDTVWVSPGTYTETLVWPNVDGITLRGTGQTSTTITNTLVNAVNISIVPTVADLHFITIRDLTLVNAHVGMPAIAMSGAFRVGGLGVSPGQILLENLNIVTLDHESVIMGIVQNVQMHNVFIPDNDVFFLNVGNVVAHACRFDDVLVTYDISQGTPTSGRAEGVVFDSCQAEDITVTGIGLFAGTDDNQINDLTATVVDELVDAQQVYGAIHYAGRILGNVDVTFNFGDAVTPMPLVLDYARISGTFNFAATAGDTLAYGRALHASFYSEAGASITVGNLATLDMRGATFVQAALAVAGSGTIDRTIWYETFATWADPQTVTFSIPYPVGTVQYSVIIEATTLTPLPVAIIPADKTNVDVDMDPSAADGANGGRITIIRPYD